MSNYTNAKRNVLKKAQDAGSHQQEQGVPAVNESMAQIGNLLPMWPLLDGSKDEDSSGDETMPPLLLGPCPVTKSTKYDLPTYEVAELQLAGSHHDVVKFVHLDYMEYLLPLMEDLRFVTTRACLLEEDLRELYEHKANGTLPSSLRKRRPSFNCGREYVIKIRTRCLDITIAEKEASLQFCRTKLDLATWAPEWQEVITGAWDMTISKLYSSPQIIMEGGEEKLVGWKPSEEGLQKLAETLADIEAIGKQVIDIQIVRDKLRRDATGKRQGLICATRQQWNPFIFTARSGRVNGKKDTSSGQKHQPKCWCIKISDQSLMTMEHANNCEVHTRASPTLDRYDNQNASIHTQDK
ncbi:hypothetical protein BKA82DRAFT_4020225 [Pisolithus tinctorius]|nr:hypothetical protein BKA82DRAFT_4023830 [Pisolithus tinctorius]KAI6139193.1 hypothetical protein BKA82DRAFT_4020225 [Pisolithus tinctorius]